MITRTWINKNGWGYWVISDGINSISCDPGEEKEAEEELMLLKESTINR